MPHADFENSKRQQRDATGIKLLRMRLYLKSYICIAALTLFFSKIAAEQNAIYATQLKYHADSPVIYATSGLCIGKNATFEK